MPGPSLPAPSLRGQQASLRTFPQTAGRRLSKRLIPNALFAIFRATDRFFSLLSGRGPRFAGLRWCPRRHARSPAAT
jgi:hypothetical protein